MEQVKEGYLIDCISGQTLKATPEEVQAVQPFAKKLMEDYGYPVSMMAEKVKHTALKSKIG